MCNTVVKFHCRFLGGRNRIFTARKRSLGQGNIFTPVCHSVHRGGVHVWLLPGGHAWLLPGGMRGCLGGHAWLLKGGHVWFYWGPCVVLFGGHA